MKKVSFPNHQDLKRRRIALGFSQVDVAKLCGHDQSMISKFEAGKQSVSYQTYFDLISILKYEVVFKKREIKDEETELHA